MDKLKVLIVDDELGIREGAKRVLGKFIVKLPYMEEDFGFDIETVEDGEKALLMLSDHSFDILLLDNRLPGINGTEVLETLKREKIKVITIMITAFASLETAVAATKHGAYDFVTKPFLPEELKTSVEKAAKHLILSKTAKKLSDEKKKVRFEFVRVLAHELKSPIAAIEGYLNIMTGRYKGDNIGDYDQMLKRSLLRLNGMRKLVMDLLDLTKIESGHKKRSLESINIFEFIEEIKEQYDFMAAEKLVKINYTCPKDMDVIVDKVELEMVIGNLLSNAIKYNREGGVVELKMKCKDSLLKISCRDSGIGMTEEEVRRLFGEFIRIKNENTRNIAGSGLGLSIVKKVVDLYNGTVDVESQQGRGTAFKVMLNLKKGRVS